MQLTISFAATMCPTIQHFYFPNYDRPLRLSCTIPKIRNPKFLCYDIDTSATERIKPLAVTDNGKMGKMENVYGWQTLTKNDRLLCDARLACHKLKLPSPSAIPNLLPCCEKRQRVTLANVPGGRGVHTTC